MLDGKLRGVPRDGRERGARRAARAVRGRAGVRAAAVHRDDYRAFRQVLEDIIRDVWTAHGRLVDAAGIRRQAIAVNAVIDGIWLEVSLERAAFDDMDINALALESILALLGLSPPGQ